MDRAENFLQNVAFVREAIVDISKLQAAAAELKAEGDRCYALAAEIEQTVKRHAGPSVPASEKPLVPPRASKQRALPLYNGNGEQKSVRTMALELINGSAKPMHVDELVRRINEHRHEPTNRAAVESQLVRAMKNPDFGIKRPSPGTYTVEK